MVLTANVTVLTELPRSDRRDPDLPRLTRLRALQVDDVLAAVASHDHVARDVLDSRRGGRPRAVAAWLARRFTDSSLRELSGHLGLTHPGSVSHRTGRIDRDRKESAELRGDLVAIQQRLLQIEVSSERHPS